VHAGHTPHPLLRLALFRLRTFRVSVAGGFITRIGIGGMPFLLPLLYQLGMGLPAWQSGMMMMPAAAGAIGMKFLSARVLRRFGYRNVLIVNTLLIGIAIALFSRVDAATLIPAILLLSLCLGFFNSLQFSSMNTMAYADVEGPETSMASTLASSLQQLSLSFGLATGSLVAGWYLSGLPQDDMALVAGALHHAFLTLAVITVVSSASFWGLRADDGESVSRGGARVAESQAA
jgi:MFS family permease